MPFSLCNTPATFHAYINNPLKGLLDDSCICYIDDIMIYLETEEEYIKHIKEVLKCLENIGSTENLRNVNSTRRK